jgi:hypothetical protein
MPKSTTARTRTLRILTAVLWVVCLCPTWAAIVASPTTFWQTFAVGCAQTVLGLVAFGVTAAMHGF